MLSTALHRTGPETLTGDLVLRVRGTARDGQLVRLRSTKCTVGSGPRCTLRLRARSIRPLHCLILRGDGGTVVRRWSADTRLNGRAFTDAPLLPGDQLGIGAIELEVVETGRPACPEPMDEKAAERDDEGEGSATREELNSQLRQIEARMTQCNLRAEALDRLRHGLDNEQQRWHAERADAQRQLATQAAELETLRGELVGREKALAEDRRQWEALHTDSSAQSAAQLQELEHARAEIDARRRLLEEEQQRWHAERADAQRQLATQAAELETLRGELAGREKALAEDRRRWEALDTDTSAQSAAQLQEIEHARAEIDARRRLLEEEQQRWQAERAEAQRQLATQAAELETLRGELAGREKALLEDRRRWEAQHTESSAQSAAQTQELEHGRAEIDARRRLLEEEQQRWQAERAEAQRKLDQDTARIESSQSDLATRQNALQEERQRWEAEQATVAVQWTARSEQLNSALAELDAERRNLQAEREHWQSERQQAQRQFDAAGAEMDARSAELDRRQAELDQRQRQVEEMAAERTTTVPSPEPGPPQQAEFQPVSAAAPVQLGDVLRRLGAAGALTDDEPEPPSRKGPWSAAGPRAVEPGPSSGGRRPNSAAGADGDEESINDYMAKLLARSRGDGEAETSKYPSQASRARTTAEAPRQPAPPAAVSPTPAALGDVPPEPKEMSPRAVAPEKHIDLSAMRELANFSAQSALDRHARRQIILTTRTKLLVTAVALAVGGGLLWMWGWPGTTTVTFYAALASFLVALLWGVQYAVLTGRLVLNKLGHLDWAPRDRKMGAKPADQGASVTRTQLRVEQDADDK